MGKAGRKKRKEAKALAKNQVEAPEGFNAKEVLYGLDSTVTETRISSSGIIAALFGDADTDFMKNMEEEENRSRTNIKYAVKAQIPKRLITHLSDSSEPVVLNCLGALRNMCISGKEDVLKLLIQQDVMTPIRSLLLTFVPKMSQPLTSVYTPLVVVQAFSLLTLLLDFDPDCIQLLHFNDQLFESIYYCVKCNHTEIQKAACECLDMISDLIPLPPSILQDLSVYITQSQGYVKSRLLSIYFSCHPPQNDEEYAPYIQELQQGLSVNLSNEINILKDIYLHIQEDEEKRTKAMAEFLGISMETDIKEMEEDPAENEKDSTTVEESEQRKEEKQKEKIYKNAIQHYLNILTSLSGYIDLLKSLLKMNNEEETIRCLPIQCIETLFPTILALLQPNDNLFSFSPYVIAPTLDVYISLYECLDVMNIYVDNMNVSSINTLWTFYIHPCVPLQPVLPLYTSKPIFNAITKCIWSYLEAVHRYKQNHSNVLDPVVLQPILDISTLTQLAQLYPSTLPPVINLIALYITLYPPHPDHLPYIQFLLEAARHTSSNQNTLEIDSCILDNLMTIFSDSPSVPFYVQLQVHPIFKQLLKTVDKLLSSFLGDFDEDIVNYAAATVENGHNFIPYIEEEMRNLPPQ